VLAAVLGREALVALAPATLPRLADVPTDGHVLLFGLFVTLAGALLMSLLPAVEVVRQAPAAQLAGAGRTTVAARRHRALGAVVAVELALAVVLLIGSGLLLRTFDRLQSVNLGFDPANLLTADLVLPESRYARPEAQTQFFREVVERLNAIPGVLSAAYVITPPLSPRGGIGSPLLFEKPPDQSPDAAPGARVRLVHGDYFGTLRLKIQQGRGLSAEDQAGALPVAVVNERFAREFWPGRSPLGERISFKWEKEPRWLTIVGVVSDIKGVTVATPDSRTVYAPYVQRTSTWQRWGTLVLRAKGSPQALVAPLKQAVWGVDPALPLDQIGTIEERRATQTAQQRFNALSLGAFAALALLVALQGVYALLAYAVEERRREIGVRMALGAQASDVVGLVLGRAAIPAGLGLLAGLALAFALARAMSSLLFEVAPTDPSTYLGVAGLFAFATLLASALPALRAARLDPIAALRHE
jgi:predicted permease